MVRLPSPLLRLPAFLLVVLVAAGDDYEATREEFVARMNAIRREAGVKALKLSAPLTVIAQGRVAEIAEGHGATGSPAKEDMGRARKAGYEARLISEVMAQADGDVETVVSAWREQEGLAARELVGADYREVGIGVSLEKEIPLYVLLFALSWEDFFREKTEVLSDLERVRREMLARVNRERAGRRLAPLRRHPTLDAAAQSHAGDMLARSYYSHDTPEGKTAMGRIAAAGYPAMHAGENIARGQYSVDEVMDGWMGSRIHRDHLLSKVFDEAGFGLAFGKSSGGYEIIWVQNFGRLRARERFPHRRPL